MVTIEKERFEAWLFSQPRDRIYDYSNARQCMVCSFLKETTGLERPIVMPGVYYTYLTGSVAIPTIFPDWLSMFERFIQSNRTFGAVQDAYCKVFHFTPEPDLGQTTEGRVCSVGELTLK